ncbi:VCBS domain-containing protein [Altererythrobacter sp. TH136]|uniref:beta strand repeat-containing protein n=1 Tax=Altererythrobacter sp. TH136 TaxID=2067415 RepID=UPI0032C0717E
MTDNTASEPDSDIFAVTVTDSDGSQASTTLVIAIADDAPTAVADAASQAAENAPVTVNVLVNDIPGADSVQPGTVTLVAGSLTGTGQLANNGDGTFTYTPGPGEEGTVTFQYSITDGDGDTSAAQVTITLRPDSTPTIALAGDTDVTEAGLPARNGEPAGSQAAGNGEFAAGTIAISTGNDTVGSLVVSGIDVTAGGTVTTAKGILTVTADSNGGYSYSYQLTDNTASEPDSDIFAVTVTDSDGSQASTTLVIAIADDAPTALDDAAALAAGEYGPIGGNVRANDTQGADGAVVTGYSGTGGAVSVGGVAAGSYGTLTVAADGTFSYTRNPGTPGGVTDTFTYDITDADGDVDTATLTITIPNSGGTTLTLPTAGDAGTTVLEEALASGSNPTSGAEATVGTIQFTAPDGPAVLTINGVPVTAGAVFAGTYGTLVVDAVGGDSIAYTYTLTTNTLGDATNDSFTIRVADQDGDFTESDLVVAIVDDVPSARPDADSVTEDVTLVAAGNVVTDAEANGDAGADTPGADGVTVTAFSGPNGAGVVGGSITGTYGTLQLNADGSYTYTLDNGNPLVQGLDGTESRTETFSYAITDGDGDVRTSTLVVTVNGSDDPVVITGLDPAGAELIVDEDDLSDGSSPAPGALTQTGSFTVTSSDGIAALTVEGTDAFVGQTFTNAYGTFTITSLSGPADGSQTSITVDYAFTLTDNTAHPNAAGENAILATFAIAVTDTDGSTATDTIEVQVIDDVPTAVADFDTVAAGTYGPVGGNVITDAEADGGRDTPGADGITVTAISGFGGSGAVGGTTIGQYGVLTIASDGTYSYVRNPGTDGGVTDTFTYSVTDSDGDAASSTLTIAIDDALPLTASNAQVQLDDDALAGGNAGGIDDADPDTANLTGTLAGSGGDGPLAWSVASVTVPAGFTVDDTVAGVLLIQQGGMTVLTVTLDSATGDYTVTQNAPIAHPTGAQENDAEFTLNYTVTDQDGDTASGSLLVVVDDDTPTAFDNVNDVSEGGSTGGNVLSDGTADIFGADGGTILSFASADGGANTAPGSSITTALGTLTLNADGSYTYVSNPNSTNADTTDTFDYTIVDSDGDTSTAQLVISIDNVTGAATDSDVNVNEAGLPAGSDSGDTSEIGSGQISVNGAVGPFTYVLVGPNSNGDGTYGTLVLDGTTGAYTYTLDTPYTDAVTENSANVVNGAESFAYEVYDAANNLIGSGAISVNITDDVPNAVSDAGRTVAEDAVGTIAGNVLANDVRGADGATLTHVDLGGGPVAITTGTNLGAGVYAFTTANGTYTFAASGAWTFDPATGLDQTAGPINAGFTYRLTDGDGDLDTATQPISIVDGTGPGDPAPVALVLDDQLLSDGRTPAATQPPADSETIAFVPGSDPFASIEFGSIAGLSGGLTWVKSADNLTVTGSQGGRPVVTLTLSVVGNDAEVVATLIDNYLHANGLGDQTFVIGSVEVVATDIDGDQATALASLAISDDLPTLSASSPAANALQVDETQLGIDASADFAGLFTPDYNADGAGSVGNYTLGISGANTGLIDTASGERVLLRFDGAKVIGATEFGNLTVFEVTLSGSTVELDQLRAVRHGDTTSANEQSPALAANLITLTATVTDADGDTATATANIGGTVRFLDDGPTALPDTNTIGEDGSTVSGSVLRGTDNIANTPDDDRFGADGQNAPPVTAISGFTGAGTVGGATVGEFGSLTLNADGTYTYTLDPAKVQNLDLGDVETDTFTYQIKDGDGDPATATLTISIVGANDGPIARADTNWTVEDAASAITGNVLANVPHTRITPGDFADVADTDVDDAVTVANAGVINGTYGVLTLNIDGSYSYRLYTASENTAQYHAVQSLGVGDAPLIDSFSYTATDGTASAASSLNISIFGANDAPVIVASTAVVSDEGFAAGNKDTVGVPSDSSNSTTFLTGSLTLTDTDATDTFTVTLGAPAAPGIRVADGSAAGAALTWAVIDGGKTLVGYVTSQADPSVVVKVTDAGTYTVEILDPIFHPDTTVEDIVSNLVIPVTVTDDSGAANASTTLANAITVVFEDDSPILGAFTPAANTVSNTSNATAIGSFAYSPGGDGHGSFVITGPTIDGVVYQPLVHGLIDISDDGVSNPVQGTTLTATSADGLTTLFTMQVDVGGNYKFTLVTADAATSETLSFKSLSAGGPGFRELDDDTSTPINENGRVEFTSNGSGVNANNNDFGVSNSFLDPTEYFEMEFHNPGADRDQAANTDAELLSEIDVIVNTLQSSGGRNGPGQSGGPNVTLQWTATNTITGATESGFVTVTASGLVNIDPSIEFNTMRIENVDQAGVGTDGGRIQIGGVQIYKVILPQDETIPFTISAKDADGDTTTVSQVSVFIDATAPVALDLDGDGVEFLSLAAGVTHDYGAGTVSTAWVAPDDGLLARNTGTGLDLVFTDDAPGAFTDLAGVRLAYDSNGDGKLSAHDAQWSSFGVWQDADSDGVVDDGEFTSLEAAGITAIDLVSDGQAYTAAGGDVRVSGSATYTRADGTVGSLADAVFGTEARTAQRTAETVAIAAVAGAVVHASTAVAAATIMPQVDVEDTPASLPATQHDQQAARPTEIDRGTEPMSADEGRTASNLEAYRTHVSADNVEPVTPLAEQADRGSAVLQHEGTGPEITHVASPALFGGTGTAGVMEALLAIAPVADVTNQQGPSGGIGAALSDVAASRLIDSIVDHFAEAAAPALPMAANDHASHVLAQVIDGGTMTVFHDSMTAMLDADAQALTAAQA